jgi:hypothetical protein
LPRHATHTHRARYPNHNFRIVGAELLQNLPLRDVPNHLLIPSFLLDNGTRPAISLSLSCHHLITHTRVGVTLAQAPKTP